jgi:RIO kinase 1
VQAGAWRSVRVQHIVRALPVLLKGLTTRYHDSHIYIIDVSQSVEHDHPKAFEFLRIDIRNVEDFFKKVSGGEVATLGPRRTWEFIVSESVGLQPEEEIGDDGEERLAAIVRERLEEERDETDDAVFMSSFIPRNLGEVYDPERDVDLVKAGRGDELIYSTLTGVLGRSTKETSGPAQVATTSESVDGNEPPELNDDSTGLGDGHDEEENEDEHDTSRPRGFRNEDKDAKKVGRVSLFVPLLIVRKGSRLSRKPSESSDSTRCQRPRRSGLSRRVLGNFRLYVWSYAPAEQA